MVGRTSNRSGWLRHKVPVEERYLSLRRPGRDKEVRQSPRGTTSVQVIGLGSRRRLNTLPGIGETPTEQDIDDAVRKVSQETQLLELIVRYPALLTQIPKDVDILSLPDDQKEALRQLLTTGAAQSRTL